MNITKISSISGVEHTRDIPVTQEQLEDWMSGTLIQRAMPNVSADDREFLISGATPEEWADIMGPDEDEEPNELTHWDEDETNKQLQ